jgi:acetyl esterase/lipase
MTWIIIAAVAFVGLSGIAAAICLSGAYLAGRNSVPLNLPPFNPAKLGLVDTDVTYCVLDGVTLKMDIYYPETGGPWPAYVYIHGGGWNEGDKDEIDPHAAEHGYLVVSLNYRLHPSHRFPAMIEDVKCAIRSLRANAAAYNLDSERIALVGYSAGGHLAALAGLAGDNAVWDKGSNRDQSSRVQAVVTIAAPTALTEPYPLGVAGHMDSVFSAKGLINASPVSYATPDDPPFLIIHGDSDPIVPVEQAQSLYDALAAQGVPAELIIVKNGGHALENSGGTASPNQSEVNQAILDFLAQVLR